MSKTDGVKTTYSIDGTTKVEGPKEVLDEMLKITCRGCKTEFDQMDHQSKCPLCGDEYIQQTIQLDCAPGAMRPDSLIGGVIKGTGLPKREAVSKFFGEYTFNYNDVDPKKWQKIKSVVKERVEELYHSGYIRYGSW